MDPRVPHLGLGLGWREDDYEASGMDYSERGRKLDEMLEELERAWSGHEYGFAGGIGPDVSDDPPELLLGGTVDAPVERAAEIRTAFEAARAALLEERAQR